MTELVGRDPDEARELARTAAASDIDALVVVGGDGSVRLALEAIGDTGVPLGLIPAGTGNDHARALGIPTDDPAAAAAIIVAGRRRPFDIAVITPAHGPSAVFGTVAATGLDALVTERANNMSWPKGQLRYPLAAIAELARMEPFHYRITVDDNTFERDLILAAVGNTPSYGGGMKITPSAVVDDGLLDLTVISHGPRLKMLGLFPTMYSGKHIGHKEVEQFRGSRIVLDCVPTAPIYADGDRIGQLPATIEVRPGGVTFLA